jgi:hypothetical protein
VIKPGYCAANSLQIWSGKPFGGGQELLRVEKGEAAQPGATWRNLAQVGSSWIKLDQSWSNSVL